MSILIKNQIFNFGTKDGKPADTLSRKHSYVLQPVTGKAKYSKLHSSEVADSKQPLQTAVVNLDDVTISLSKDGYRDMMKLADNFATFNQRLKYAHFRPLVPVKADSRSWWKYAYRAVSDQMKKASGKMSWEQVLRYTRLQKRYISLYASLLKSDPSQVTISGSREIEDLDRELDIELILQWRMLAHKFVEKSTESNLNARKQKVGKSWWSFGWNGNSPKEETEEFNFNEEDWNQLNKMIGYKEGDDGKSDVNSKADVVHKFVQGANGRIPDRTLGRGASSSAAESAGYLGGPYDTSLLVKYGHHVARHLWFGECWIHEYFPIVGKRGENWKPADNCGLPRAMRWSYRQRVLQVDDLQPILDELTPADVIWRPFQDHRA
ncbi:uncharacterized protein LOC127122313 [Lathyrus oleraceus]|uniref:uncharacterized protein LOC127122313 n=1 Tax=Pisum sativum TaxID=3888 RepID=UPI0021D1FCE1|nr:uncharacterized protein LOC127122313 [Pisum sativum]